MLQRLLQYYPASPDAGSPYGTGNETFGQGAQYKRLASIVGDIEFQVILILYTCYIQLIDLIRRVLGSPSGSSENGDQVWG